MLENLFNYENMYPTARPDHAPDATNFKTTLSYRQELESLYFFSGTVGAWALED